MAGSNVATLNSLLDPYHIAFGTGVYTGNFRLADQQRITMQSSTEIIKFPKGGYLIAESLKEQVPPSSESQIAIGPLTKDGKPAQLLHKVKSKLVPTIGVLDSLPGRPKSGSILAMTDSDCLNGDRSIKDCLKLIE